MNEQPYTLDSPLQQQIQNLLSVPTQPDAPYLFSGTTFGEVHAMARSFYAQFSLPEIRNATICLSTPDRSVIAAAMLAAALRKGPHLLVPYADSPAVLDEMHRQAPYAYAITEDPSRFPAGIRPIMPLPKSISAPGLPQKSTIDADFPFLSLFTGGSTGRPKIWPKTVRNLFGEAFYLTKKFDFTPRDRIVATVPPCHIYGILFSVLVPLVSGAGVINTTPTFPKEIIDAVISRKATILVSVPLHYRTLSGSPVAGHVLRAAFSSAGALDQTDSRNFARRTGIGVTEIYGSTETGGIAYRCRTEDDAALTRFETVDVEIVDEAIHVRSDYISPGVPRDADGFFRTGDRGGKFDADRFILYGRSDGIVKIGGKRVDLEEVREKILSLPDVADALILALPGNTGRENEIAALLEGTIPPRQVREHLARQLEPYALPRHIRVAGQIPRNAMGKYDMEAILELFQ